MKIRPEYVIVALSNEKNYEKFTTKKAVFDTFVKSEIVFGKYNNIYEHGIIFRLTNTFDLNKAIQIAYSSQEKEIIFINYKKDMYLIDTYSGKQTFLGKYKTTKNEPNGNWTRHKNKYISIGE